jgi:hypothetical protein
MTQLKKILKLSIHVIRPARSSSTRRTSFQHANLLHRVAADDRTLLSNDKG